MYSTVISAICLGLAVAGCIYTIVAGLSVRAFGRRGLPTVKETAPGITVLKPLHGAEPGLYETLATFLAQDYDGPVQIVFGVAEATDAARPVVQRLMREHPTQDIELVIAHRAAEGNAKIANLAAMAPLIAHDLIVLSDSDIEVTPGYLRDIGDALAEPGVGLVTCVYRGAAGSGLWAELSTMAIDFHFLPSALFGVRFARARPCLGATMAFSKETLAKIGGFDAFATHLADDYAIGEAVRATGQRVVLGPQLVTHRCNEQSFSELFVHELRWARTIRSIDPRGYAGTLVTHPLPFAVAALACGGAPAPACAVLVATMLARASLQWQVERVLGGATGRWLLGPLRDAISFFVFVSSFLDDVVVWRGRRYRIRADGTMENLEGSASLVPVETNWRPSS
jgi:ceramide glucosyltransferase